MPIRKCRKGKRPGFRWGKTGTCYTYPAGNSTKRKAARAKAEAQGRAIKQRQSNEDETNDD